MVYDSRARGLGGDFLNIMNVMTGDLWAGAEVQLYNTIHELNRQGDHSLMIVLFSKGELYFKLEKEGFPVFLINEEEVNGLSICFRLSKLIREHGPDVVHVHDYKSHITSAIAKVLAKNKCHIIRTLHGLKILPRTIKIFKSFVLSLIENSLLRHNTSCIVAVSKDIEKTLRNTYRTANVFYINNAIKQPTKDECGDPGAVRKDYNVAAGVLWIGAASRLVDVKNIGMLIDAAKIIKDNNCCNFKVYIFGDGPKKESLQQKINDHELSDTVTLQGYNNNIVPIINAFSVFVNSSNHEGLPMSILESMAVETVPVCTRVGGMQELIEDSISGLLVEPGNAAQLADALMRLCDNRGLIKNLGTGAKARVSFNYSIESSVESLLSLYETFSKVRQKNECV